MIIVRNSGNTPSEPGIYWAKGDKYEWWNLIVDVGGVAPFLRVDQILNLGSFPEPPHEIREWGAKIEPPNRPREAAK